jgi:hypothetical protein
MRLRAWKEGCIAGTPDLFIPWPNDTHHGLFIEMKRRPNTPTKEQTEFLDAMAAHGYAAHICYDWQEALNVFCEYVGIKIDLHFSV